MEKSAKLVVCRYCGQQVRSERLKRHQRKLHDPGFQPEYVERLIKAAFTGQPKAVAKLARLEEDYPTVHKLANQAREKLRDYGLEEFLSRFRVKSRKDQEKKEPRTTAGFDPVGVSRTVHTVSGGAVGLGRK